MFRRLIGPLFAASLAASVVACGGGTAEKKPAVAKSKKAERKQLLANARSEAKEGNVDDADEAYEKAYEVDKDFDTLEERVDFLTHAGKATKAQEVAKVYYDDHATDAKGYALYADALLAGNKGAEALEVAESMISLDADDPAGHEKKGLALLMLDKSEEGLDELKKAVQLDSKESTYHISLGTALQKLGQVNDAALEFRAALKASPDEPQARVALGAALRDQGELDESLEQLKKALVQDPDNGRAYFELGLLYNKQGKAAEAESSLAKAVQKSPNESLFWYAYGEIFRLQARTGEALNAYQKAVDLDPPYPKAIAKLGLLLIERKQYDDAERFLTQSVRRDAKNPSNYLNLGAVYAAKKKNKLAIENFEKFLGLAPKNDPDRARAKEAIQELKRR
ncbi:hypothetical protein BH11MYX2_BH11MYX2_01900 [soil metagenome]